MRLLKTLIDGLGENDGICEEKVQWTLAANVDIVVYTSIVAQDKVPDHAVSENDIHCMSIETNDTILS